MKVIQHPEEMQQAAQALHRDGKTIGFVPTMGFLHEGHLSLMRLARERCDVLAASIFVNPAQFGPNEDLNAYPRDFERDEALCRKEGVDLLFYPTPENIYLTDHSVWVNEESLSGVLCGAARPGHFRGVCTVVAKLLNIVLPDWLVLGEKDAQQLRVLRRMVRDLNFPVEIISVPTVREADGLAMSSRNKYLTPQERTEAGCLFQGLEKAKALFSAGERRADVLRQAVCEMIAKTSGSIDYAEIVDDETMAFVQTIEKPVLFAIAVRFSSARLIDNAILGK
jgi:pantoate--beta-alanine ligase